MSDALTQALADRVKAGIDHDGWRAKLIGTGWAVPSEVQAWLKEEVGLDAGNAVLVVFDAGPDSDD